MRKIYNASHNFFYILLDHFPIFFLKIWSDINYDYVILYIAIVHVFHHKLWFTLIILGFMTTTYLCYSKNRTSKLIDKFLDFINHCGKIRKHLNLQ